MKMTQKSLIMTFIFMLVATVSAFANPNMTSNIPNAPLPLKITPISVGAHSGLLGGTVFTTPAVITNSYNSPQGSLSVYVYITDTANNIIWQGWSLQSDGSTNKVFDLGVTASGQTLNDVLDKNGNATIMIHYPQYGVYVFSDGTIELCKYMGNSNNKSTLKGIATNTSVPNIYGQSVNNTVKSNTTTGFVSPYLCDKITIGKNSTTNYCIPYNSL